jgi:RND family efflux transporter MFP subunit
MKNRSHNETDALRDEPRAGTSTAEVIFPAVETAPTTAELKESVNVGEVAVSGRKRWPLLAVVLVLVAFGITIYIYVRNRPRPVPASPVDLHNHAGHEGSHVPQTAFKISHEKQQLIGVQYGTVEYQSISKSLRAVGKVAYDETKITRINPKFEGWIESVYVDFTGKLVQKGQPLLSIYSPDLVQTQQEYLLALKGRRELGESPFREAVSFSESLVQSARRRLELWDVSDQQIRELEKRGAALRAMTIYAPASGFVMTRNAFPRQRVLPDTELYTLADLSTVWIIADIYEFEAADVKLGQLARVTLSSFPERQFSGKVTYIFPQVDNETRTLKVRIELANRNFALKADMFADVVFRINYGSKLVVPQEAVMDSGSEQLVYVSLDDGYFEPRKIQIGAKVDDKYIVLDGLHAGERIVTSGNFLIDSESKLKSASGGMGPPAMDHGAHK